MIAFGYETGALEPWSKVEEFPAFMKAVREVKRVEGDRFPWRVERGGNEDESVSQIILRNPVAQYCLAHHLRHGEFRTVARIILTTLHVCNPHERSAPPQRGLCKRITNSAMRRTHTKTKRIFN